MKFLCAHCANGSMRIVAVDGSAVRIECLRCGQESLLEMAPTMPGSVDDGPGGRGERQAGGQDPEVHAVGHADGIGDDHHIGGADYRSGAAVGAAEKSTDG
jgi:hypothetical protein